MEDGLILVCKYGDKICPVLVKSDMDFGAVMEKICRRWTDLDPDTLIMTYSLIDNEPIVMEDDVGLATLWELAQAGGINDIEVVIEDGSLEFTAVPDSNLGLESGQMSQNKKRIRTSNMVDDDMITPSFVTHKKKTLKSAEWAFGIKSAGQCFVGGVVEFRNVLRKYCIERGIEYVLVKNDKERVTAHCKHRNGEKKCMWEVHGRVFQANGFFYIRNFVDEHTCGVVLRSNKNPRATSELIGSLIVEDVRAKSKRSPSDIIIEMKREYGLDVSYHQAWWALESARGDVYGDFENSFSSLNWYVREARQTNPGSHILLEVDEESKRFKRLFVAFRGCIDGFRHCRPILFLDGTFLKGRQKGQLLGATGKTGNQEIFPLCFAIVDSENRDNWLWFLQQLYSIIDHERRFTFISDRNLGLLEAMKMVFPTSPHGYCLYHLTFNLRYHLRGTAKGYRETMVHLLRLAAHAPTLDLFNHYIMRMVTEGGPRVTGFLKKLPVKHWSTVHFPGCRYGELYSNVAESFNSWIKDERNLPIRGLVDAIQVKIMDMIAERSKKASEWVGKFCPKIYQKLNDSYQEARTWVVSPSGNGVYEVQSEPTVSVNIVERNCSCQKWQQDGLPCCHAVGVIASAGKDLSYYVDPYYYADTYRASYSHPIHPIPTLCMPRQPINGDVILPPLSKKPAGRPKSRRIPSRGEKVSQIRCGRCHKLGNHNRSTCKEAM